MIINFIGNFQNGPGGERADEVHMVRELIALGHQVRAIARDEWREYVLDEFPVDQYNVPSDFSADLNIICKWHHFEDGKYVDAIRDLSGGAPVFYWCWDYMEGLPDWHVKQAQSADLYLSGELGFASQYREVGVKFYYLQFDSADRSFPPAPPQDIVYDVVYMGSYTNQNGRMNLLKEINKVIPITVFAYDYETWIQEGFTALPAVYGDSFNKVVQQSRLILGTSGGPHCYGYWSNRVGKVIHAGGRLLQQYTPGMETLLPDGIQYFSTPEEAVLKIRKMLSEFDWQIPTPFDQIRATSLRTMKQLATMAERYIIEDKGAKWILP